jgi:hypothetical protein
MKCRLDGEAVEEACRFSIHLGCKLRRSVWHSQSVRTRFVGYGPSSASADVSSKMHFLCLQKAPKRSYHGGKPKETTSFDLFHSCPYYNRYAPDIFLRLHLPTALSRPESARPFCLRHDTCAIPGPYLRHTSSFSQAARYGQIVWRGCGAIGEVRAEERKNLFAHPRKWQ